jgi:hypothetical protein
LHREVRRFAEVLDLPVDAPGGWQKGLISGPLLNGSAGNRRRCLYLAFFERLKII